jgi:hypothetical protein
VRSISAVQFPSPKAQNYRSTENYGDQEKVVNLTYGDEISETPYGLLRKCVDDVTSQRISRKLKSVAQKHRSADYHVQFLPSSRIRKVLGKSAVLLELSRHKEIIPKGAEPNEYQKILAVLYLAKMPSVIGAFVTAGVGDAYLPFDEAIVVVEGVHRVGLRSRRQPDICCPPTSMERHCSCVRQGRGQSCSILSSRSRDNLTLSRTPPDWTEGRLRQDL